MFANFFQLGPIPTDQMVGVYDPRLVILSYLVASFASYIALDFTGRLRDVSNTRASNFLWLMGGAVAMGSGIWSMHFIGMLSFTMEGMTLYYDFFWTGLSLLVAIFASGFALFLLKVKTINFLHLAVGGIILGFAIASMHYTGMEAMKIQMHIRYLPGLFFLSIIIAILASEAALWLALKSNQVVSRLRVRLKIISAAIMGMAICGMHYTGMAAAIFTANPSATTTIGSLDPTILSLSIAGVTFIILGIAFFASTYKEALNQQQLEAARQLGMAEVATSVLHNVGNVLNSVNVSANIISEKLSTSQLEGLQNLDNLITEHKQDLGTYLTHDPHGMKVPAFISLLANYWRDERQALANELKILLNNVDHISTIISMQQGLSKMKGLEQIILIEEVLDESILITGIENNTYHIKLEKNYEKIKPIQVDKIKLLQVFVNLLSNAKDSLKLSNKQLKILSIQCYITKQNIIYIKITDNGIGILPKDLKNIFSYGFTTKESGHGFGLHTCALAINEMGGSISCDSAGYEKGATFTIQLPYRSPQQ